MPIALAGQEGAWGARAGAARFAARFGRFAAPRARAAGLRAVVRRDFDAPRLGAAPRFARGRFRGAMANSSVVA
jgi:hypothetical protein